MRTLLFTSLAAVLLLSAFHPKRSRIKLPKEFIRIPAGNLLLPDKADSNKRVSVSVFYISKFEVTNQQYRKFFNEVSIEMPEAEKELIACDTTGWMQAVSYSEPLKQHYFRHPSFDNYPVVNVSFEGAVKYCKWLQQEIGNDNPDFDIEVRIPTKAEWIWAAQGGRKQAMFPWGNYYLRNKKGEPMCNFKQVKDQHIYRNRNTGKPEVVEMSSNSQTLTAEVKSFYTNDYGLYNMCGNVAEIIEEKGIAMGGSWNDFGGNVHIRAESKYERSAPTIGFRPVILVKEKK